MHGPEFYEKREIRKYLDSINAWHVVPTTYGRGGSGMPDIIACVDGRFVGIEVKREGNEPSKLQEKRIDQIHQAGGIAVWGTAEKVVGELHLLLER